MVMCWRFLPPTGVESVGPVARSSRRSFLSAVREGRVVERVLFEPVCEPCSLCAARGRERASVRCCAPVFPVGVSLVSRSPARSSWLRPDLAAAWIPPSSDRLSTGFAIRSDWRLWPYWDDDAAVSASIVGDGEVFVRSLSGVDAAIAARSGGCFNEAGELRSASLRALFS